MRMGRRVQLRLEGSFCFMFLYCLNASFFIITACVTFLLKERLKKTSKYILYRTIVRSSNGRYKFVSFIRMYLWINGLAWCL